MSAAIDLQAVRRRSALERALGPAIADALARLDVVEALVNADGRLWLDVVGAGLQLTEIVLSISDREAAVRLLANEAGETVGEHRPSLAAILPGSSARVQAVLPPISARACDQEAPSWSPHAQGLFARRHYQRRTGRAPL